MTPPANDNAPFRCFIRSVKDKRTGNEIRVLKFPQRHPSHVTFMEHARKHVGLNPHGVAGFAILTLDMELKPSSSIYIDELVPLNGPLFAASAVEAFRKDAMDDWDPKPDEDDCA